VPEKERSRNQSESQEELTHTVSVHGKTSRVDLPKGATLKDLLDKFKKQNPDRNMSAVVNVIVDGVPIEVKNGELTHNPVLSESAVVSLVGNITGGRV